MEQRGVMGIFSHQPCQFAQHFFTRGCRSLQTVCKSHTLHRGSNYSHSHLMLKFALMLAVMACAHIYVAKNWLVEPVKDRKIEQPTVWELTMDPSPTPSAPLKDSLQHQMATPVDSPQAKPQSTTASTGTDARHTSLNKKNKTPVRDGAAIGARKTLATPVYTPSPNYPLAAKQAGQQGVVIVKFLVNQQGKVERPDIVSSSGFAVLDQQARQAVRKWRFTPTTINDQAVAHWFQQRVIFAIEKRSQSAPEPPQIALSDD